MATLEDELARTTRERTAAQRAVDKRKQALAKERGDVERAVDRKQAINERIGNTRKQLQKARKAGNEGRVDKLQDRLAKRRDNRSDAKATVQRERSQVAPARSALSAAQKKLSTAQAAHRSVTERRQDAADYLTELRETNPWLAQLGIDPAWLQNVIASASSDAEIAAKIRQTPQYRRRFVGITRPDGTQQMNEAEYIRTEDAYRQLLRQHGVQGYDRPEQLVGFFQGGIDPNELGRRLEAWREISTGGQSVREAFYVYAGMNISEDDLLAAVIDPARAQNLTDSFNQGVAQGRFDYNTWIARATAAGLGRVAARLRELQAQGAVTATAVQSVMALRPEFAQQIMSAIYRGAGDDTTTLSLAQVLEAFEFAAIGSAARGSGLEMPTLERLREIRAAGIDRARAIEAYTAFGKSGSRLNAAMLRARGMSFGQTQFERAAFLNDARLQADLELAEAQERAAGEQGGSFRFAEDPQGRIVQRGFRRPI